MPIYYILQGIKIVVGYHLSLAYTISSLQFLTGLFVWLACRRLVLTNMTRKVNSLILYMWVTLWWTIYSQNLSTQQSTVSRKLQRGRVRLTGSEPQASPWTRCFIMTTSNVITLELSIVDVGLIEGYDWCVYKTVSYRDMKAVQSSIYEGKRFCLPLKKI